MRRSSLLPLFCLALLSLARCFAQAAIAPKALQPSDPLAEAALDKARELSVLHQESSSPFRLQASFETYDYKGNPDGKGALTEVYLRPSDWKRSILYRGKHSAETVVDGTKRTVSDEDYQYTFAQLRIIGDLFEGVPPAGSMKGYTFSMKEMKTDTAAMTCVLGSLPYRVLAGGSANLDWHSGMVLNHNERAVELTSAPNQVYCLDKEPAILRVIEGHNGLVVTFNRIMRFGSIFVPGDITMMEKGKLRAHLHVDGIVATPDLTAKDIVPPAADAGGPEKVSPAVMAGHIKNRVSLYYPPAAKMHHAQGTVVVHGILGKDGRFRDLELVSTPDDSLADSALDAVRQWEYTPYLVNGKPAEVDTTVSLNYTYR